MKYFIDVILPIPLQKLFTYQVNKEEAKFLQMGMRVAVPFGTRKIYTGLVFRVHHTAPTAYEAKDIHSILDEKPIVTQDQFRLWEWIANYYMCTVGEVMRAAIPSALLLQSESKIVLNKNFKKENTLNDQEFLIFEALQHHEVLDLEKISAIISRKTFMPIVLQLLEKKVIQIHEVLYEKYVPKYVKYLKLITDWEKESDIIELLDQLSKAPKQKACILYYFQEKAAIGKPIVFTGFLKKYNLSQSVIKALIDKGIFEIYSLQEDRIKMGASAEKLPVLSKHQLAAKEEIEKSFVQNQTILFHGITGSGKTEIYIHLIANELDKGKQVLYLVPEIALTTQLLERLKRFFGPQIIVFHSRYSVNERVEVWQNIIDNNPKTRLIVGARSAVLLPFQDLGLIVVDEAHETSYKQFEPAPRYHARDTAIVLASQKNTKVLLGTATPSIESYFNVHQKKYSLVTLDKRYGAMQMPDIQLVDLADAQKKKQLKGHFSQILIDHIQEALDKREQVILFQNRRGYAPMITCTSCGVSPQCPNCDVSLTYHKSKNELKCHYCNFIAEMPKVCAACANPSLTTVGFGTEQLENELQELFPKHKTGRMDFDTTRGKDAYFNIITAFESKEIDILVGTQMLSKGLDFSNVSLVGVINADQMLNFPDFRAHERSFQMLVQVSGRAGRSNAQGKVLIQSFNPNHPVLQWVLHNDFQQLYKEQMQERWLYKYPPYFKLIKISVKHKNYAALTEASKWLGDSMYNYFKENVLGPSDPAIGRIRGLYIKDILIKIPASQSVAETKKILLKIKNHFQSIAPFRAVRMVIDVDNY